MQINFLGGSYKSRSTVVNRQELVNWFLDYYGPKEDAKTLKALIPTPGLKYMQQFAVDGGCRGMYTTSSGRLFVVYGNKLIEVKSNGTYVESGELLTTVGMVSMSDNGEDVASGRGLIIVDGTYGYIFNLMSSDFNQITDPAFVPCTHVVFLDGYFIINEKNSGRIWVSNIYNGLIWGNVSLTTSSATNITVAEGTLTLTVGTGLSFTDITTVIVANTYATLIGVPNAYNATTGELTLYVNEVRGEGTYSSWIVQGYIGSLSYATAESSPDNIVALHSIHGELWIVGDQSTEVWYNSGAADFPFARIHGAISNNGTVAPYSVQNNGSNLFWLGSSAQGYGQIWSSNGYQPKKISTPSIDYMVEQLSTIEDAVGWCYTAEGHNFYCLSFIAGNKTLCYDLTTDEWHERAYWNPLTSSFEAHRVICAAFAHGRNYVGDRSYPRIYELSLDTYTDNGEIVRRVRTGPHIHQDRCRLFHKEFEIDIERGIGLDGDVQGSEPMAMLQWSDDGGFTFSNETWRSFGRLGEYKRRMVWHRLGMSRDRVYRLTVTDPAKCILVDARIDISAEIKQAV